MQYFEAVISRILVLFGSPFCEKSHYAWHLHKTKLIQLRPFVFKKNVLCKDCHRFLSSVSIRSEVAILRMAHPRLELHAESTP